MVSKYVLWQMFEEGISRKNRTWIDVKVCPTCNVCTDVTEQILLLFGLHPKRKYSESVK